MLALEINRPALAIERVAAIAGLVGLEPDWRRLMTAGNLDPFNAWEWQAAWWHRLAQGRALWVLVAREADGQVRGIVPLSLESTRIGFWRVRRLGFLADELVGSDYLEVIAAPGWRPAVVASTAHYLAEHAGQWDVVEWRDMDAGSDSPGRLRAGLGGEFASESQDQSICPGQRLDVYQDFETFLAQTRRYSNYQRRRRWLEKQPGFRIDISSQGAALASARDIFFDLHARRWAGSGGSAGIPDATTRAFHTEATERLARCRQVRFYTLWVRGRPVASVYGLVANNTFYYYQSGMDPAWRSRSVGLVLIGETFADAFRLGLRRYDFLRGSEAYKADWVGEKRQLVRWRFYQSRGAGRRACRAQAQIQAAKQHLKRWLKRPA